MMGGHQDCPICLGEMTETDDVYPLLCPTRCGFNMCIACVQHLVESSKDDYQEASDGNRHVKVSLCCPQCRGDVRETIQDILLMRRAKLSQKYKNISDSELKASELRIKHEFQQNTTEVQHAQLRLNKYQRDRGGTPIEELLLEFGTTNTSEEEEPSTTTTTNGNYEKSKNNGSLSSTTKKQQQKPSIDSTLFNGFEYYMSEAEQQYVTQLLTSGDPSQLAQAAQILHGIFELMLEGRPPTTKATSSGFSTNERQALEQRTKFLKLHPLPARMPKFYTLQVFSSQEGENIGSRRSRNHVPISFEDEEWDGSIAQAFSRVHALKKLTPGMENILAQGDVEILPSCSRIKVGMVRGVAGKMGLQKGDIITHFNGEIYMGNAADLTQRIYDLYDENPIQTFSMVVNADESIAEILKLRAMAASNIRKAGIRFV